MKSNYTLSCVLIATVLFVVPVPGHPEEALIFSAPPRENPLKGKQTYGAIATFLSKVSGKEIVYKHSVNWLAYSQDMRNGRYDIVFDGPHFVSWRIKALDHTPLVRIPGGFSFMILAKKENNKINTLNDLISRKVCGHEPPNQGTLRLYNEFENPMRLPVLKSVKGWRNIYKALIADECDGAIVPAKIYNKLDSQSKQTRILLKTAPAPGQAITVSNKFTADDIQTMRTALLSPEGIIATEALRKRFASQELATAMREEYDSAYKLLEYSHGFSIE